MSGLVPGLVLSIATVLAWLSLPTYARFLRWRARRGARKAPVRARPAFGRMCVDPQYVRDRYAEIVRATPELCRTDPRLLALYVIPLTNEED